MTYFTCFIVYKQDECVRAVDFRLGLESDFSHNNDLTGLLWEFTDLTRTP